ncbi:MAG TPA: hypothetical protein VFU13_11190 [Steroidobacteraceae bacterium]|nr:hypothetical protein [Steroidobacteraceae bacterium]
MPWKYFKYSTWALVAAAVFAGTTHAGRSDALANYWPWMALGGILIVLTALARFARRHLPAEA